MYKRDDCDVIKVELLIIGKLPLFGTTWFGAYPDREYCFMPPLAPLDEIHPTIALEPTIPPLGENPIAIYEFWFGAERMKLHMFEDV